MIDMEVLLCPGPIGPLVYGFAGLMFGCAINALAFGWKPIPKWAAAIICVMVVVPLWAALATCGPAVIHSSYSAAEAAGIANRRAVLRSWMFAWLLWYALTRPPTISPRRLATVRLNSAQRVVLSLTVSFAFILAACGIASAERLSLFELDESWLVWIVVLATVGSFNLWLFRSPARRPAEDVPSAPVVPIVVPSANADSAPIPRDGKGQTQPGDSHA